MANRARQGLVTLGDQSILFAAAMRGIFQRPFYVAEFLDQCRFILTSCVVPLMLTGLGRPGTGDGTEDPAVRRAGFGARPGAHHAALRPLGMD